MKTGNLLLLGGAGLIIYYLSQLGVAGKTVQFVFKGVSFLSATKLQIQLMVQNVSNANITLNALTGDVTINGNELGSASTFTPVDIPGASQQQINLILDISILSLPSTIINLINQAGNTLNFQVTGNANINSLVVPFSVQQAITI